MTTTDTPRPPAEPVSAEPVLASPPSAPSRKVWVVVGSVLAAVSLAWGAASIADLVTYSRSRSTTDFPAADRVVIDTDGSVQLRQGADDRIRVTQRVAEGLRSPTISERMEGSTLRLSGSCPSLGATVCSVDLVVEVPPGTPVTASSGSNDISATGLTGDLDLSSSAGDVTVERASGRLRLTSDAGVVSAGGLESVVVDAESSADDVRLSFSRAPQRVVATSSAGAVLVVVPRDGTSYRVDASSDAGTAKVDVPTNPSAGRHITATSSADDVSVRPVG